MTHSVFFLVNDIVLSLSLFITSTSGVSETINYLLMLVLCILGVKKLQVLCTVHIEFFLYFVQSENNIMLARNKKSLLIQRARKETRRLRLNKL